MDDKLKLTLQKIKALTLQNKEFAEELVKMLDIPMSKQAVSLKLEDFLFWKNSCVLFMKNMHSIKHKFEN